ncbi:hypothetical protein ACVMIH_007619 [Bradyrhizobium sp. USDA 4503]
MASDNRAGGVPGYEGERTLIWSISPSLCWSVSQHSCWQICRSAFFVALRCTFAERSYLFRFIDVEYAEPTGRRDRRHGGKEPIHTVKADQGLIDVGDAISVGHTDGLIANVRSDAPDPAADHCVETGIDQPDSPMLGRGFRGSRPGSRPDAPHPGGQSRLSFCPLLILRCHHSKHEPLMAVRRLRTSRAAPGHGRDGRCQPPTGSREAVARLALPQNVACGFTALRSSAIGSQPFSNGV